MYTLTKGPSSIAAKTRRGISQNYEKFDTMRDINKKMENGCEESIISVPKPVFQTSTSRKVSHHMKNGHTDEESMSPQHEELVKYIHESWNMVVAQNPYDAPKTPENKMNGTLYPAGLTQQPHQQQVVLKSPAGAKLVNGSLTQSVPVTTVQTQAILNTSTSSLSSSSQSSTSSSPLSTSSTISCPTSPSIYYCDPPSPILSDFKPFDLESWWGRRLFHNITKSL